MRVAKRESIGAITRVMADEVARQTLGLFGVGWVLEMPTDAVSSEDNTKESKDDRARPMVALRGQNIEDGWCLW